MLFELYAPAIGRLPGSGPLSRAQVLVPEFRLARAGSVAVYFAPLEYVNSSARVAIIGITPGWTQTEIAYRTARDMLRTGAPLEEIEKRAKQAAAFAGSMRTNLLQMLDELGVPRRLGLDSASDLFGCGWDLIHTTSILRYPVFLGDTERNYTGHNPRLATSAFLRAWLQEWLRPGDSSDAPSAVDPIGARSIRCRGGIGASGVCGSQALSPRVSSSLRSQRTPPGPFRTAS